MVKQTKIIMGRSLGNRCNIANGTFDPSKPRTEDGNLDKIQKTATFFLDTFPYSEDDVY